jgi:hypothetical protein
MHSDMPAVPEEKQLTFGEKAVGLTFNPGGDPLVTAIKGDFAQAIDTLHAAREAATDPEVKRMLSTAITNAQTAQMWGVKGVTWK